MFEIFGEIMNKTSYVSFFIYVKHADFIQNIR